jgi:16S rRNA (adenine1518-N6/adenine1519-N6)-dimethyltransferase
MRARKRFGQHFLTNGRIADRIVDSADLDPGDTVLEIGPGKGILTSRLLDRVHTVVAVEIDRDLAGELARTLGGRSGLRIVEGDILAADLPELFRGAPARIRVVSNIPYNISSPIVDLLIRNRAIVSRAVLMVQKEVARRLTSAPGSRVYGLTSINLALRGTARILFDVKPGSFAPPPEVTSSVVMIEFDSGPRVPEVNDELFRELTGAAFRQRRKMVRNTIIPFLCERGMTAHEAESVLYGAGVDPQTRPERIGVEEYAAIAGAAEAWERGKELS